ncbi:MAG: sulfurtransferase TusA family protein [Nitrososphaerota archaeon]
MSIVVQRGRGSESLLGTKPTITLDTRGMVCPYPMIEARKLAERLSPGEVAELITDIESTARTSIPLVCEGLGLDYVVVEDPGLWRVRISPR